MAVAELRTTNDEKPPIITLGDASSATIAENDPIAALKHIKSTHIDHPIHWPALKKWSIITMYCLLQVFVTMSSTTYVSVKGLVQERYGGSNQVVTLGQSMFIVGTAVGPVFLGPLSDLGGRKWIYVVSTAIFALLNIGTALALNLPMLIIFQFLAGAAGSTALTNVVGTITDLFGSTDGAGQPMALFAMSANVGPGLGSPIGEIIVDNASMGRPWVFWINVIVGGAFAILLCFIPETLPRVVIRNAGKRRHDSDVEDARDILAPQRIEILRKMTFVVTMALRILFTEPIVLFLGVFNGFAYGLLFLYLTGVWDVFVINNGLSYMAANLTYLNFVVGAFLVFLFIPVQTYLFKKDHLKHRHGRPEARFLTSLVIVWLFPVSLLWFAFTCDGNANYWSPIVAGTVLGFCGPLLWLSMLNYIADSYSNFAGSAIAAFCIPSFGIAGACAHVGVLMFANMSAKWAMATLGFISFGLVALIYVLYFFGAKVRHASKLAT